jgi:hypothetical protein
MNLGPWDRLRRSPILAITRQPEWRMPTFGWSAPKHASPHSSESVHALQLCTPMHRPTLGPTSDSAPMLILPRSRSTSRGLEIALVF